jgi:hypothetical protein
MISFAMLVSPWAFGTSQKWSPQTMSVTGYALGALLFVK